VIKIDSKGFSIFTYIFLNYYAENSALHHKNKLKFTLYSHRNQLF